MYPRSIFSTCSLVRLAFIIRDQPPSAFSPVTASAGFIRGIVASYDTKVPCHTPSEYLTGDSLRTLLDECHREGIRVIARTDFSKVRYPLYQG